jgi:hypothetical protein
VIGALAHFLAHVPPPAWTNENVEDLLYVLEASFTADAIDMVTRAESAALAIARHSLGRGGVASDDIAERLGACIQHRDQAEFLLMAFIQVPHERTRRMALLSLARLRSTAVPELAAAAWDTGDEHQRIGALEALRLVDSDLLSGYLSKAVQDGRASVVAHARRCAESTTRPPDQA